MGTSVAWNFWRQHSQYYYGNQMYERNKTQKERKGYPETRLLSGEKDKIVAERAQNNQRAERGLF